MNDDTAFVTETGTLMCLRSAGALAHAGSTAKGATGHLAEFFPQASLSQGGVDRESDQSHRRGQGGAEGSRRGRG